LHKDMQAAKTENRAGHFFGPQADGEVFAALELARSGLRPVARRATTNTQFDPKTLRNPKAA
jgi:hypothetical protein